MDNHRFATLAHALTSIPSRRHVLHGLAGLGLALGASWLPEAVDAKKKRKKKNKPKGKKKRKQPTSPPTSPPPTSPPPPPTPNAYGCLSVDVPCTSAAECCTGICEGGMCRGHGAGTCSQEAEGLCLAGGPALAICNNSSKCPCLETTGGSKFCGTIEVLACTDCRKDADCLALGFPAGSACAPFSTGICAGVCANGMVCVAPCGTKPVEK